MRNIMNEPNGSICPNCNEPLIGIGLPCLKCGRDLTYEKCEKTCYFNTICHKADNHNCRLYSKMIKCPACNGEGAFWEQHGEKHECPYCYGTGKANEYKRMEYVRSFKGFNKETRKLMAQDKTTDW